MGRSERQINQVTGTVIGLAVRMIVYAVLLLVLLEGCVQGYSFGHEIFCSTAAEAAPGQDRTVLIEKGMTSDEVIDRLKEEGLIRSPLILKIQIRFYEYTLQPGTYLLNTSMTPKEILWTLDQGTGEEPKADQQPESETQETKAPETETAKPDHTWEEKEVEIRID